jgi:type IV pilus assembly protein PilV
MTTAHPDCLPRRQRGITLIESLVSLVIVAIGIMGLMALQMRALVNNQNANYSATAARLAENLFERVRANPNADLNLNPNFSSATPLADQWGWLAGYAVIWDNSPTAATTNCDNNFCTADDRRDWDIAEWRTLLAASLPNANAQVAVSTNNPRQLVVVLGWRANEQGTAPTANPGDVTLPDTCGTTFTCYVAYGGP